MSKTAEEILAETRAFNDTVEGLLAAAPSLHTVDPVVTRKNRMEGKSAFPAPVILPEGQERVVRGRSGDIPIRVFIPPTVRGAYLHIHGGGWVLGNAQSQDPLLWRIAQEAQVAVVSVEYRLAPEDPYPAGVDDCEDAALWFVKEAPAEFGVDRLSIGGESAGAHLSVVTLLRLRDRHGVTGAFNAANLVYGCYDLSHTPSQRLWGDRNLILSGPIIQWFTDSFLPGIDLEARRDPDISPLYADLRDMPQALFSVGTLDPLIDDSLFMAARWQAAGNEAQLLTYEEGIHGFTLFPITIGMQSTEAQIDFLREAAARG